MARDARSEDADSRGIGRMHGLDDPTADPARRRTAALNSATWRLLRARVRDLLLRSRLGQWALAIRRVRADYRRVTGRAPALLRPRRFTEKMQWRKLFELDPLF